MSDFIIAYSGSKRKEYYLFNQYISFQNKNIFIEPFCGSGAMCYNIYKEKGLGDNKFILNDINPNLIKIYNIMKELSFDEIETNINEWREKMKEKEDYDLLKKDEDENIWIYLISHKFCAIRAGLYPATKSSIKTEFKLTPKHKAYIEFIKSPNVIISNKNWFEIFEEYKDNKNALFLFDPPYIQSCNGYYEMGSNTIKSNVYEYFADNINISYQASVYFILEKNWIINLLFKGKKSQYYDKKYEASKRKTTHMFIEW